MDEIGVYLQQATVADDVDALKNQLTLMVRGRAILDKINAIELRLPDELAFDTYALKSASGGEIKQVEQGKS